jgi:hypothetical protein
MRRILKESIPAFSLHWDDKSLKLDFGDDQQILDETRECNCLQSTPEELDNIMVRALIRTLFVTVFQQPIDKTTLQAFLDYIKYDYLV